MWRTVGTAGFVGIYILLALGMGHLGGQRLDRWLGTAPWLKWLGTAMGVGVAVHALVWVVRDYQRSLKRQEQQDGNSGNDSGSGKTR
jgi:F0F1-type ATP synthase assembly protein I